MPDGGKLAQGLHSHIARMLDLVLAEKGALMGIGDERWNFAVYLHDPGADELVCVVCRRPVRADEEAPHRRWRRGEGHVGLAWGRGEELVTGDATDPQIERVFRAPEGSTGRMTVPVAGRSPPYRSG